MPDLSVTNVERLATELRNTELARVMLRNLRAPKHSNPLTMAQYAQQLNALQARDLITRSSMHGVPKFTRLGRRVAGCL